ncbi:MAG: hypothetical protein RIB02_07580 [Vicingaceae bacterium]
MKNNKNLGLLLLFNAIYSHPMMSLKNNRVEVGNDVDKHTH